MALFESYFDPGTYGGSGSLIDRLLSQLGTQQQYQPGPGFGQSPMDAQASVAPPDQPSNPIAVGNYQMPRIGGGFADAAPQPAPAPIQQPMMQPPLMQHSPGGFGGAMRGALANMHGGPLGLIGGAIAGGMGMGQGTEIDQANNAVLQNYKALIAAGVPQNKAVLAAISPQAAQVILSSELGADKYGFQALPDGTLVRTNQKTGEVSPAFSGGTKPTFGVIGEQEGGGKQYGWIDPGKRTVTPYQDGTERTATVTGPDGKPIAIPPGVDRKTFVNEVSRANAKAAAGELTEAQAKATIYASKMELAEKNLKGLDDQYTSTIGAGGYMRGTEYVPGGNALQSENYQKYKQARDNFITALLRQESGAAIGTAEFNRYEKELFPQPGDSDAVVKQKREARRIAIEGMKKGAGPGYRSPTSAVDDSPKADPLGIR
jgi:hypothetical protein